MAMADAANQAAWYKSFLTELKYIVDDPIPIHGDNKGAIDLALNPVTGRCSKHIDIRCHVIREYIVNGIISLISVTFGMVRPLLTVVMSEVSDVTSWTTYGLTFETPG